MIDLQFILTSGLGLFSALLGWLGNELWKAVQSLRKDLGQLEIRIGTDYVRYDRLQDVMKPVMAKLENIEAALTHKQDKP